MFYFTCDRSLTATKTHITNDKTCKIKVKKLKLAGYNTCNLQPITAYRPINGISPLSGIGRLLTEHVPDDRHHGGSAAHFLATFNFYCSCVLQLASFKL